MPIFKISDIIKIADKGQVLSGQILNDGTVSTGDIAITTNPDNQEVVKIIGIHSQRDTDYYGLLISFSDFEKISNQDLKDTELNIISVADRQSWTHEPILWTGDLADDCSSNWSGLLLRAECMDKDSWWWAVYDMQNNEITIDSSNYHDIQFVDGHIARQKAEDVAKKYLNVT